MDSGTIRKSFQSNKHYSDDTLVSFLAPVAGTSQLAPAKVQCVIHFWYQSLANDRICSIPCHHLRLRCFLFWIFFNNLKAITAATTLFSSKSETKFVLFLPVSFAGEVVWYQELVSGTIRLALVSGDSSRHRQLAPENWQVCHRY